ncbi:17-beta-hydroxysteroid dehydrogenase 14 [Apodemus sylvaticus]|uniref:17-beta-hydroxysteroid dehydrogenase 14 n=1 Tax=Apodemus sylvaticus TaxID=10129 RepID=UPI00224217BA|nr:17-beta-hydroxysteroid dehydrogenase 14 [Apodemus sylvaticus]
MAAVTRYSGKVVVVTGGSRGIGAAIVRAFAARVAGALDGHKRAAEAVTQVGRACNFVVFLLAVDSGSQVVFCDKDEAGGRALEQEVPGTVFIPGDVTQEGDLQTLISETLSRFGHLDCVVNNAGYHPPAQSPEETSAQSFRQLLEVNLLGTYTLTKLALPHLRKSRGNIINISSLVGAIGQSQAVTYVATKGAVTAMTKALALDESRHGVRVNCISPGNIWTPLWEELAASTSDPRATILEGTLAQPLGRMGQPAEVAAAAVFLASEATFCTGLELLVTGGAELGYGRKASRSSLVEVPTLPPNT